MKQFLSIILRNEFNLFYRFGYTFVPSSELIEFEGTINEELKAKIVKKFANTTPFEYDEEYLILHLETEHQKDYEVTKFDIRDVVSIYPLSRQAKTSIESKIDQRIKLEKPVFESVVSAIESEIENKEVENAIVALWAICKVENPLYKYLSEIELEKILKGLEHRKNGIKAFKIQSGTYWEYLIAYDRFDYFPNSTLGYFYDAGQIFAFSKGHSTFEGSGIYNSLQMLNSSNPTIKLPEIIKYFDTEEQLKGYVSKTTIGELKQYIVAPLYLMLRDEIRKSDDLSQTKLFKNLDYLKKFGDSFNYALILLGAFFGFRKFYDYYYDVLNLRLYKSYKADQKETVKEQPQEIIKPELIIETQESNSIIEKTDVSDVSGKPDIKEDVIEQELEEPIASQELSSVREENKENKSDNSNQYRQIIEQAFKKQNEIVLTDIAALIKEKTKQKVTNTIIKNVIKQIGELEIIPQKKPETARRKATTGTLFDQ